ncbi:MAG: hypothetical protein HY823_14525 [Acidobacteria bacterium]|nr:hypothetical protein [Acidobacteriota bacterium]
MTARGLFLLYFVYLVLEGALRKWLLPAFSNALFLVKDVIVLALVFVLGFRSWRPHAPRPPAWSRGEALLLAFWPLLFGGFALGGEEPLTTLLGLRYYLVMVPLAVALPLVVEDLGDLNRMAWRYLLMSLPVLTLGLIQFASPQDAFINRYAWRNAMTEDVALFFSDRVRITGTFSYISPFAAYLQALFPVALALFAFGAHGSRRLFLGLLAALFLLEVAMTGSRATFLICLLTGGGFLLFILPQALRARGRGLSLAVGFVLASTFLYQQQDVFLLLKERNEIAEDAEGRVKGVLYSPFRTLEEMPFSGEGIGSTFQGVRELSSRTERVVFAEVVHDRIGVETGFLGLVFVLLFKGVFLFRTTGLLWRMGQGPARAWAFASLAVQVSSLWSIPVYNSVAATFFFGAIGVYGLLRRLEKQGVLRGSGWAPAS